MTLLYFAGPPPFETGKYRELMHGRRVLVAFGEHRRRAFADTDNFRGVVLDSGAWSAFQRGKPVDIDAYVRFCSEHGHRYDWYAAADVIGNPAAGMRNFERMLRAGLRPVPVFHGDDPWSLLGEFRTASSLVALGSSPSMTGEARARWFERAMGEHPGDYHLFRVTDARLLRRLSPASADSSTWARAAVHGYVPDREGRRVRADGLTVFERAREWVRWFGELETELPGKEER